MVVHVSGHGGRHTTTPRWNGVTMVRLTGGLALGAPVGSLWTLVYSLAVSLVPFTLTPQCKLVWGSCKDPSLHSGACTLLQYHTAWYCTPHGLPCMDYK